MFRGSKRGKSHVTSIASTVMFGLQDTNVRQISVQFSKIHSITNYKIVWTLDKRNMEIESVYLKLTQLISQTIAFHVCSII